jgi:hypothetical protein
LHEKTEGEVKHRKLRGARSDKNEEDGESEKIAKSWESSCDKN